MAQLDPATGVYDRDALLSLLFCETDRAQRMKTALSLLLFGLDGFASGNSSLGRTGCNALQREVAKRTSRLLRSYDLLGRTGDNEFLVILPGCGAHCAIALAERLRAAIFAAPFSVAGLEARIQELRISACFGAAASNGRSPLVVLREAEEALVRAKERGPGSIQWCGESPLSHLSPDDFLLPKPKDNLLGW